MNMSEITELDWIEGKSIRFAMRNIVSTKWIMLYGATFLTVAMYGLTTKSLLLLWYGSNVLLSILRWWYLRGYSAAYDLNNDIKTRELFFRYRKIMPVNAFVWGISIYLIIDVTDATYAICCLAALSLFSILVVSNGSYYLRMMKDLLVAFAIGMLVGVLLHLDLKQDFAANSTYFWYSLGILAQTTVLFILGTRMNGTYIEGLQLQFRNQELIASLTEQREAALSAVETKNRMLASAAHDMRQPVLALDLYAGWLVADPSSSYNIAPKIAASTQAVIGLFDSLFDLARLTEGKITTQNVAINLDELVSALYMQYQPLAMSKNLSLRVRSCKVHNQTLWTDRILLERILGNLISNGLKYSAKGGVLLACRISEQTVTFEVWDTGVGISPEEQKNVFKEFYKSPSNKGTSDGFGLGLTIVSQLADLLEAKLTLRSRGGYGTVVRLKFDHHNSAPRQSVNPP